MAAIFPGFEYDIFISYRHNDNRSGWVTDFVNALQEELAATIKDPISIYFDKNPHDGLLETHSVDKSLESKLKCLIFIPIISQTYCDPKSFAWQHEFCAFNRIANEDQFGRDIKLANGNVASRILPVRIHDLDVEDQTIIENELKSILRAVDFIFRSAGVNRPLRAMEDHPQDNLNKTFYRDQINKVANAVKEIIGGLKAIDRKAIASPQSASAEALQPAKKSRKRILLTALGLMILFAFVYAFTQLRNATPEGEVQEEKSIAVIPFVNMSNDPEQEYFSDGITEQIITNLAHVNSLKVIARTSSMKYKKTNKSIAEIGKELDVTHVLEGSIRISGDRIRVTGQLISVAGEVHLWAQDFERSLDDIFAVQDEISMAIANSLERQLTPREFENMKSNRSANVEAYRHFLKGMNIHLDVYYIKRLKEDFFESEKEFKTAIRLDPGYAVAYAGLADLYDTYRNFTAQSPAERMLFESKRDSMSVTAIRLSPNDPFVIAIRAWSFANKTNKTDADIDSTFSYRRRAYALAPNNVDVCDPLSIDYSVQGLLYQALQLQERVINLDPTYGDHYAMLGNTYVQLGEFQKAEPLIRKALLLQPEAVTALQSLTINSLYQGKFDEAQRTIQKIKANNPETSTRWAEGLLFAYRGERDKALSYNNSNQVYLALGLKAEALDVMEKEKNLKYLTLKNSPVYNSVRNDPRFVQILEKARLAYEEKLKRYAE